MVTNYDGVYVSNNVLCSKRHTPYGTKNYIQYNVNLLLTIIINKKIIVPLDNHGVYIACNSIDHILQIVAILELSN